MSQQRSNTLLLTADQFYAIAKLIRLREDSPAAHMSYSVIVNGLSYKEAADKYGSSYNAAYQAVARINKAYQLVKQVSATQ